MPRLVLFEAYGTREPVARSNDPEGVAVITAAKLARVMKPDTVYLSVRPRKVTVELVKGQERVQVVGEAAGDAPVFEQNVDAKAFSELATVRPGKLDIDISADRVRIMGRSLPCVERPEHVPLSIPRKLVSCLALFRAISAAGEYVGCAERYDFDKILLDPDGTDVRVVASDKSALYHAVLKNTADEAGIRKPVLLPWSKVLATPVFAKASDIRVACGDKMVTIAAGNVIWQHDVAPGRFPLYREVVESAVSQPNCHIAGDGVEAVLERLKDAERQKTLVALLFGGAGTRVFIGDEDTKLTLPVSGYVGEPLRIGFNPRYLRRGLSVAGLKTLSVPKHDCKPVAFNNGTVSAIVMPCGQ